MGGPAHAMMTRANMARAGVPAGWQDDYDDGDMGEDDDEEYGDHEMDVEARAAAGVTSGEGGSRGGSRGQGHDRGPRAHGGGRQGGELRHTLLICVSNTHTGHTSPCSYT